MDAVILAGGQGTRLSGTVPRYFKPMVLVNGEPLIRRVVRQAKKAGVENVIVVCAPQNVGPIADLLVREDVHFVVQPSPTGPGDALRRGLHAVTSDYTLVLMGDNVTQDEDMHRIAFGQHPVIGVREIPNDERSVHFTRLDAGTGEWIERAELSREGNKYHNILAWIGPLKIETRTALSVLEEEKRGTVLNELLIGKHLSRIAPGASSTFVDTMDIGLPDALEEVNECDG